MFFYDQQCNLILISGSNHNMPSHSHIYLAGLLADLKAFPWHPWHSVVLIHRNGLKNGGQQFHLELKKRNGSGYKKLTSSTGTASTSTFMYTSPCFPSRTILSYPWIQQTALKKQSNMNSLSFFALLSVGFRWFWQFKFFCTSLNWF